MFDWYTYVILFFIFYCALFWYILLARDYLISSAREIRELTRDKVRCPGCDSWVKCSEHGTKHLKFDTLYGDPKEAGFMWCDQCEPGLGAVVHECEPIAALVRDITEEDLIKSLKEARQIDIDSSP